MARQELEKSKMNQEQKGLPHVKGDMEFKIGDCVYLKNEVKAEGKKLSTKHTGPLRIIKKYDNGFTFKMTSPILEKIIRLMLAG